MSYTKQHTKLVAAMLASLALSGFGWRIAPVAAANPGKSLGTKMVYIDRQTRMDPVTIEKVTVGSQLIQPGVSTAARVDQPATPFQADQDWLKNMSISLKNRTDKVVVRAEVQLFFPDTGNGITPQGRISPTVTVYTMELGQRPEIDSYASHGQKIPPEPGKQPLLLAPGQTLVIHVADHVDEMHSRVEETLPFSQVTRVAIRRLRFFFVDGMRWTDLDRFGIPDPNHPGQFTNLDSGRYFPGHPSQNWPPSAAPFEP
jgi:hypothetical protein